jgi:hypothetical protein
MSCGVILLDRIGHVSLLVAFSCNKTFPSPSCDRKRARWEIKPKHARVLPGCGSDYTVDLKTVCKPLSWGSVTNAVISGHKYRVPLWCNNCQPIAIFVAACSCQRPPYCGDTRRSMAEWLLVRKRWQFHVHFERCQSIYFHNADAGRRPVWPDTACGSMSNAQFAFPITTSCRPHFNLARKHTAALMLGTFTWKDVCFHWLLNTHIKALTELDASSPHCIVCTSFKHADLLIYAA